MASPLLVSSSFSLCCMMDFHRVIFFHPLLPLFLLLHLLHSSSLPFLINHSASPSFSCNGNIPVTRRGKSLLVIFFSRYLFSFSLLPSLRKEASRMKFVHVAVSRPLLASLPHPHSFFISSLPPRFSPSRKI